MIAILVRSILLVCFAILAMRLMGKRQIGQLQPFELVIAIMIADLASTPMASLDIPLWHGVVPLFITVALHQLFTLLSLKSQRLRAFFSGRPTVVIRDGQIDYRALEKLCFNLNDLLEELRTGGVLTPTEVGTAIMETSGKISVFPKSQHRALTPADMQIETGYEGIPLTLVMDGRLQKENLPLCGQDEVWLRMQLNRLGFKSMRDVLLCYLDTDGRMTAHPYSGSSPSRAKVMEQNEVKW
ncbi:MAG: DUF421 domain-containing protein [Clostridia bacterium]|nr:DUF421 domain-containing protein [Clostridia bacterium]